MAETPITETLPTILYDDPNAYISVVGSTQFGAERGVVYDSIPVVLRCRTTPTLKLLDL